MRSLITNKFVYCRGQTEHPAMEPVNDTASESLRGIAAAETECSVPNGLGQSIAHESESTEEVFWDCSTSGDLSGRDVCTETVEEELGPQEHASMTSEQGFLFSSMRMVGFAASGVLKNSPHQPC